MLDLIFVVLMIVIIVKANNGEVNDTLCNVALVIGVLAGILGVVQTIFSSNGNSLWGLNILVMLFAFALKRVAQHFAKLHNDKIAQIEEEYRKANIHHARDNDPNSGSVNYNDPNVRFGGGNGNVWNGK